MLKEAPTKLGDSTFAIRLVFLLPIVSSVDLVGLLIVVLSMEGLKRADVWRALLTLSRVW